MGSVITSGNLISGNVVAVAGAGIVSNGEISTTSNAVAGDVTLVTSIGSIALNQRNDLDAGRDINTSGTNLRGGNVDVLIGLAQPLVLGDTSTGLVVHNPFDGRSGQPTVSAITTGSSVGLGGNFRLSVLSGVQGSSATI